MSEALNIKQIRARFNREKPKYIGLKNADGAWEVPLNNPNIKVENRMVQIEKFFQKDSTPDGIYYFISRESLNTDTSVRSTPVAKGNVRNLPVISEPVQPTRVQARQMDQVWDAATALEKNTEIIRLTFQVQILQAENDNLHKRIRELEDMEIAEGPEDGENGSSGMMGQFKSIVESLTPVIDKHFELREKEIAVKNKALERGYIEPKRGAGPVVDPSSQTAEARTDGGVPANDPNYEDYFARVYNDAPEELYNYECDYLEAVNPDLFNALLDKYEGQETEENGS